MTVTTNGHMRKTLAAQIDRLDSILDGLSEGLNEAVAGAVQGAVERAVRQAVGQAVKETLQAVLAEIMSNADLLAAFRGVAPAAPPPGAPPPPPGPPQGLWRRAGGRVRGVLGLARSACGGAGAFVLRQAAAVKAVARAGWRLAGRFRGRVLAACGVGVLTAVVTYAAEPWLGVAAGWLGGFVAALAVQARNALRRLASSAPAFA